MFDAEGIFFKDYLFSSDFEPIARDISGFLYPDEVEIVQKFHNLFYACECHSEPWNQEKVDAMLKKLGQEKEYAAVNGYLCDVLWFKRKSVLPSELVWFNSKDPKRHIDWKAFDGIYMACESESDGKPWKVLEDFDKVTSVIAPLKVFVHSNRFYGPGETLSVPKFVKTISPIQPKDRYLFIGHDGTPPGRFKNFSVGFFQIDP